MIVLIFIFCFQCQVVATKIFTCKAIAQSPNNHSQTDEGSQIIANLQMHKYYQQVAIIPSCTCIAILQQLDQFL